MQRTSVGIVLACAFTPLFAQMIWIQTTPSAGWTGRSGHTSVAFDGKMWVLGGYEGETRKNDVWYSTDGVTWTQATTAAEWSARGRHTSVVFDGKMWVLGGNSATSNWMNDVWWSENGVDWTEATGSALWSPRLGHTSVVFDGKMWVLGGSDRWDGDKNDVWYSTDGVNWTWATTAAGWTARDGHTSVAFDGKMWVLGGNGPPSPYDKNDVWYSTDGVTWTQAPSAEWTARAIHTSVVFDGKIWVLGGVAVTVYKNDVWYSSGLTGIEEDRDMPAAGPSAALCVTPNPLAGGFATVSFSLAKPGPMTASVHDVSGLCVATVKSLLQTRVGSVHLDLRKLASGVYLVRLEANGCSIRQKLIVQR